MLTSRTLRRTAQHLLALARSQPTLTTSTLHSLRQRFLHTTPSHHQQAEQKKADPPKGHVRVSVDGFEIDVPQGTTVLQACEAAGVHVPRFCYHDRLSIAGNCRMCLVEVEKSPKPVASCAMPTMPNMKIKTQTPLVAKAREGVMEFLLQNHPLDCPICDQGGECDLQDQSVAFGNDRSRFREVKRTVEDKNLGPLIKTVMTRCIHCTRCVRFAQEIAGTPLLGTTGRGQQMEIGTYIEQPLDSELSGNVIDLCPVGALTSKPYAFTARPWELSPTESLDVHDALGSSITVFTRGLEVMRILPRLNEEVNEEWISDKARFSYDGLKRQRLDMPLVKDKQSGELKPVTWPEALHRIKTRVSEVNGDEMLGVAGEFADAESLIALRDFFNAMGSTNLQHEQWETHLNTQTRGNYLFNSKITGVEDADFLLLVGTNPRMEAAVLNARIRKGVRENNLPVYSIGPEFEPNYRHTHLGNNTQILYDIAAGKHELSKRLKAAENPMIIIGTAALKGEEMAQSVYSAVAKLKKDVPALSQGEEWNGINILHTAASRVAAADLGYGPQPDTGKKARFVYLMGAEQWPEDQIAGDALIVYTGSHGDRGASAADIILPTSAYVEKSATYLNTEGRVQVTMPAVGRLANARDDWQIARALAEACGATFDYTTLDALRHRLAQEHPQYAETDSLYRDENAAQAFGPELISKSTPKGRPFEPIHDNFYFTNAIARNSRIMAQSSAAFPSSRNSYTSERHSTDLKNMKPELQSKEAVQKQAQ